MTRNVKTGQTLIQKTVDYMELYICANPLYNIVQWALKEKIDFQINLMVNVKNIKTKHCAKFTSITDGF